MQPGRRRRHNTEIALDLPTNGKVAAESAREVTYPGEHGGIQLTRCCSKAVQQLLRVPQTGDRPKPDQRKLVFASMGPSAPHNWPILAEGGQVCGWH